jgi:3-oxoacyl-[acyl-carrier protein] reductase
LTRNSEKFTGKTVMIVNAAGSIGLATARLFHKGKANVVMNDTRIGPIRKLEGRLGRGAIATDFDLAKQEAGVQLVQVALEKFKSVDILICNEGMVEAKPTEKITPEDWDKMTEQNLTVAFHALQGVYVPFRSKQRGTVILVSSLAARSGCSGMINYASSMGGVLGIMKSISKEWSRWGVTCSAVCPGPIAEGDQGMSSSLKGQFAQTQTEMANRNVTAEEVARVILFLASEDGRPINGQAINVDYGLHVYNF